MSERIHSERVPLTTSGRRQIEDEAQRLQMRLAELRELLEDAHADRTADDDERAAALALLDEHARLEARLSELRAILESALDGPPVATDVAGLGTMVRVREDDGTEETFTLVSPAEASPTNGWVSVNSRSTYPWSRPAEARASMRDARRWARRSRISDEPRPPGSGC